MNEQPLKDTIMEIREGFMISPVGDSKQTFRTAHFLKPIASSIHELNFNEINLNSSSSCSVSEAKEWPLKIHFNGWHYPHEKWIKWVDELQLKYESVWKKACIFEPIMSTKSCIIKNQDLVCGVVEKWCCETNTFVFLFGEATITLEDVIVLGGYSLFGLPVFAHLEDQEMREVEQKLINIESQERISKGMAPSTSVWMDIFIDKGSEVEHEAFLATWLSIFVFPHKYSLVKCSLFPVAVHLARGNPISLAPAVLASLYNDLRLFKNTIVDFKKFPDKFPFMLDVNVQSPFYLVQVWVWERFKNLQPQPKLGNNRDHVLLRWHNVKALKIDNVRLALDSVIDDFIWRPYVQYVDKCGVFYPKDETLVPFKKDLVVEQMLSFVIFLRVSELVGFESIEQYLPHRVAMQFGFDQDVPGYVSRLNETKAIAWKNYSRPLSDTSLYFPSRYFEAGITSRYAKWWTKSVLRPQGFVKNLESRKRSASISKCEPHANIPPEFPSHKLVGCAVTIGKSCDDDSNTSQGDNIVPSGSIPKVLKTMYFEKSVEDVLLAEKNVEDCEHLEDVDFKESNEGRLSSDTVCQPENQIESYNYLFEVSVAELEQRISRLEKVVTKLKMARLGHS
ncbi:uncharacterized protein [Medicago truncatula]|uniref:uncharacterized protein n=1 Tax=Medicago truncatula TaxID=3880 RepID=UPI000D2F3D0C|nr:uncharacterized protein LOC112420187 [Medicago truncatula]